MLSAWKLAILMKAPSKHLPVQIIIRNTRGKCELCSKLTIKTSERLQ